MPRTKNNKIQDKADAILTGDWHLREDSPVCRTDNFWETQWKKIDFISELQKTHKCPVWHSGDLFNYWKPSPMLLSKTIEHLPKMFSTVYGNHDLPQHSMDLNYKSGIYTLEKARVLQVFPGAHWLEKPISASIQNEYSDDAERQILVWHVMTYQGKEPFPGCTAPKGAKLLRRYSNYDLILTGDNHVPFIEQYEDRLLVNPGSIFRMNTGQENHKPRVYLWYAESNTVIPVYLPIEEDVISRNHVQKEVERDNRINAFIETLQGDWTAKMSFEENIEAFKQSNNIRNSVMDIIYKSLDYEKN